MVFFNEAEAVCDLDAPEPEQETTPNYALLGTFAPINAKDAEEQRMYILDENASWSLVKNAVEGEQVLSPYRVYMQTKMPNAPATIMMREAVFNIVIESHLGFPGQLLG